ncbi:MAG: SAP domain-containing protein [Anaerotignum sp.]
MGIFDIFRRKRTIEIVVSDVQVNHKDVIPAEIRTKDAFATKDGLYPHEILVLSYADGFAVDHKDFQNFWWYSYGVKDVSAVLKSLKERGFIEVGNLETAIKSETVVKLKEVLKSYNLKVSGKKAELIKRLLGEVSHEQLNLLFPKRIYILSGAGALALEEAEYIPYIHKNMIEELDIWSLNKLVNEKPDIPYRDKIWGYLNERSMLHMQKGNFGLYRNCRHTMSKFLAEENRLIDALAMLAEVVFIDLTGLSNSYNPELLWISAPYFFPYKTSSAKTAYGIINSILDYQNKLELDDNALKSILLERMNKLHTPIQLFSPQECVEIIFLERDQNSDKLEKIYLTSEKRFKKNYPKIDLNRKDLI